MQHTIAYSIVYKKNIIPLHSMPHQERHKCQSVLLELAPTIPSLLSSLKLPKPLLQPPPRGNVPPVFYQLSHAYISPASHTSLVSGAGSQGGNIQNPSIANLLCYTACRYHTIPCMHAPYHTIPWEAPVQTRPVGKY